MFLERYMVCVCRIRVSAQKVLEMLILLGLFILQVIEHTPRVEIHISIFIFV